MTYTETVGRLLLAAHALYGRLPIDASEVEKALDCGDALGLAETDDHRAPRRLLGDQSSRLLATASVTGVERTRMDDVAPVVGIALPNLYRHVSSKDAVMALVVIAETKKTDDLRRRLLPIEGPVGTLVVESLALENRVRRGRMTCYSPSAPGAIR